MIFVTPTNAPLVNGLLRTRVRVQSQADPAKLRRMLGELEQGSPIYDAMVEDRALGLEGAADWERELLSGRAARRDASSNG